MTHTDPLVKIVEGCRRKDPGSQEQLYRYCYPNMIRVCERYAFDLDGAGIIFNNAMLRVFKFIEKYEDQGKLMAWIKTIMVNCCLDFVRKEQKIKTENLATVYEDQISIPEDIFDKLSARDIREIIQQLPRTTAIVFNLFIYEGYTHKQIGQALNISDNTSKWHVNEGRKLIKSRLEQLFNFQTVKNAVQ